MRGDGHCSVDAESIAASTSGRYEFADRLEDASEDIYLSQFPQANIRTFHYEGADYLFDERLGVDRTVLVLAPPASNASARDANYQRGYPLPPSVSGRAVDRGHFIAHSAGGDFGPNLFIQDTALNRGWSRDGRAYRALERAASAAGPGALLFVRPIYIDETGPPAQVELGYWDEGKVSARVFQNRFDNDALRDVDRFGVALGAATNGEAAALGEECARVLIENVLDGILLDSGDSAAERDGHRQGLDLLMLVDGDVVAFEVKTRHVSRDAGRLTRAGNLPRPRLRSSNLDGLRQGSDLYLAVRADQTINAGGEYGYPESRVVVVDLVAMLAQVFPVTTGGRVGIPEQPPMSCEAAVREAYNHIVRTRGSLGPPRR